MRFHRGTDPLRLDTPRLSAIRYLGTDALLITDMGALFNYYY